MLGIVIGVLWFWRFVELASHARLPRAKLVGGSTPQTPEKGERAASLVTEGVHEGGPSDQARGLPHMPCKPDKLQKRCAENTISHSVAAAVISGDSRRPGNAKVVKTLYNTTVQYEEHPD